MAITLSAKPSTALQRYEWVVPVGPADSYSTAVLSVTSGAATIASQEDQGDRLAFFLDGGTNNTVCVFAGLATTSLGQEIVETFYLPIIGPAALLAPTARDVCYFALRPVFGLSETPSSDALADAMERLNQMLALWKASGGDVGAKLPLAANDTLYLPDEFVTALKYRLLLDVAGLYQFQPSASDLQLAKAGMQLMKQALAGEPAKAAYF